MPVYSSLYELFSEPQIALYFAVLLWAALGCARRSERALPLVAAAATLSVTWAYIVRYTVAYEGTSLFDDAYKDVLAPPHFGTSAQLLTWVVVAAAWSFAQTAGESAAEPDEDSDGSASKSDG